ncbi:MAG TPA: hypothetical protein VHA52_10075 [Candidatus Babeliaceae bacterium]|nr:hypothetical protein [Candidatus Babeliaceae bacterium]
MISESKVRLVTKASLNKEAQGHFERTLEMFLKGLVKLDPLLKVIEDILEGEGEGGSKIIIEDEGREIAIKLSSSEQKREGRGPEGISILTRARLSEKDIEQLLKETEKEKDQYVANLLGKLWEELSKDIKGKEKVSSPVINIQLSQGCLEDPNRCENPDAVKIKIEYK